MDVGQNVKAVVKGSKLIIEVDLAAPQTPSKSGTTNVVASTKGNAHVAGMPSGMRVGLNVFEFRAR